MLNCSYSFLLLHRVLLRTRRTTITATKFSALPRSWLKLPKITPFFALLVWRSYRIFPSQHRFKWYFHQFIIRHSLHSSNGKSVFGDDFFKAFPIFKGKEKIVFLWKDTWKIKKKIVQTFSWSCNINCFIAEMRIFIRERNYFCKINAYTCLSNCITFFFKSP